MRLTHPSRAPLRAATALAGLLWAGASFAQPALPLAPPTTASVLKRLAAGHDELTFRGEAMSRVFSISLSRSEAAQIESFQLGLLNAVTILPDLSALQVSINGRVLFDAPLHSSDRISSSSIKIPAGVLVPGSNSVRFTVTLAHRVDCSLPATYELWALLDPAQTGFVMPASALYSLRSIEDLSNDPAAKDGTTHIRLRLPENAPVEDIERGAHAVTALVSRARFVRPVVDVGREPGEGPGFDLVLTPDMSRVDQILSGTRVLVRDGNVVAARNPTTQRVTVLIAAPTQAELDAAIEALGRSQSGEAPVSRVGRTGIFANGEMRATFAEAGFVTTAFAGRRYVGSLAVTLPADFYPANYDKARIFIDGSHIGGLSPGSSLVFRVNGALVSSLALDRGAERFRREQVDLPLHFFHPGYNEIEIEGLVATLADERCDPLGKPKAVRMTLSDTSELEFPHFAHLLTLPQLPAAIHRTGSDNATGAPLDVYLPSVDAEPLGAALTVLANMSLSPTRAPVAHIHVAPPTDTDRPGLVIATEQQLAPALQASLAHLTRPEIDPLADAPDSDNSIESQAHRLLAGTQAVLRKQGFFFGSIDTREKSLPMGDGTLLLAAVKPSGAERKIAGFDLPDFVASADQWLVVMARSEQTIDAGIRHLVSEGHWPELSGQAAALDLTTDALQIMPTARSTYVVPSEINPSDIRPILGGMVSDNIVLSLGLLIVLMSLLGASTHVLLRRLGQVRR